MGVLLVRALLFQVWIVDQGFFGRTVKSDPNWGSLYSPNIFLKRGKSSCISQVDMDYIERIPIPIRL